MAAMWSPIIGLILLLLPLVPSTSSYIMYPLGGSVYPTGHYYVTMNIGEPLKPYFLDIDTGSNITWLECQHPVYGCQNCSPGLKYYYQPTLGNLKVECKDPFCAALHADLPGPSPQCTRDDPHQCHYGVGYVDGTTEGVLANDTISFGAGNNKPIVFGCGYNQKPVNPPPVPKRTQIQGILGLGTGKVGFVAQLMAKNVITKNVIGHCLGMGMKGGGYLFIGDYKLPSAGITWTWAPMRKNDLYYSPGQATLHLGGQQIYANGMDAVFDSGATYTFMPARIYNPLVAKVEEVLGGALKRAEDEPALPYCWKKPGSVESFGDVKRGFNPLALRFDNNLVMNIPPKNYLILTKDGNMCLGILDGTLAGQDERIIIGDVTMQNMLVVYDNERGMLGWASTECAKPTTTSHL